MIDLYGVPMAFTTHRDGERDFSEVHTCDYCGFETVLEGSEYTDVVIILAFHADRCLKRPMPVCDGEHYGPCASDAFRRGYERAREDAAEIVGEGVTDSGIVENRIRNLPLPEKP